MTDEPQKLISYIFLYTGVIFFGMPLVLNWFIHGDSDRYLWIIRGPSPFSHFGGSGTQLVMHATLVAIGTTCLAASIFLRKRIGASRFIRYVCIALGVGVLTFILAVAAVIVWDTIF